MAEGDQMIGLGSLVTLRWWEVTLHSEARLSQPPAVVSAKTGTAVKLDAWRQVGAESAAVWRLAA